MKYASWRWVLRLATVLAWIIGFPWLMRNIQDPNEAIYEPLGYLLGGLVAFAASFRVPDTPLVKPREYELGSDDDRRRREALAETLVLVCEQHRENHLHRRVLIELAKQEDPAAVARTWCRSPLTLSRRET